MYKFPNFKTKKIFLFVAVAVLIVVVFYFLGKERKNTNEPTYTEISTEIPHEETTRPFVKVGDTMIRVDIARTSEEQKRGLSGRGALPENDGMLFLFSEKQIPRFWMKDMKFPIDIVWISDGVVVGIEENIDPQMGISEEELRIYTPPEPIDVVLEINAGKAAEWGVKVGGVVSFY